MNFRLMDPNFLKKMLPRMDVEDDPLGFVLRVTEIENPSTWDTIQSLLAVDHISKARKERLDKILDGTGTRATSYRRMNAELSTHPLYKQSSTFIPASLRFVFTRIRLSSHRLHIEMGRWSRGVKEERVGEP